MRERLIMVGCVAVLLGVISSAGAGIICDWTDEYEGDGAMPDGAWSYKWDYPGSYTPGWFQDMTWDTDGWYGPNGNYKINEEWMYTNTNYWTILEWKAPQNGTVDFHAVGLLDVWRNADYELLSATGGVVASGTLELHVPFDILVEDLSATANESYYLRIKGAGSSGLSEVHYSQLSFEYVPEPATMAVLGLGGLVCLARRRKPLCI